MLALICATIGCDQEPAPPLDQAPAHAAPAAATKTAPADHGDRPEKIFTEWGALYKNALANAKEMGTGGFRKPECCAHFMVLQHERTLLMLRVDAMLKTHPDWTDVSATWFDKATKKHYLSFRTAMRGFHAEILEGKNDEELLKLMKRASDDAAKLAPAMKSFKESYDAKQPPVSLHYVWRRLQDSLKIERKRSEWWDW